MSTRPQLEIKLNLCLSVIEVLRKERKQFESTKWLSTGLHCNLLPLLLNFLLCWWTKDLVVKHTFFLCKWNMGNKERKVTEMIPTLFWLLLNFIYILWKERKKRKNRPEHYFSPDCFVMHFPSLLILQMCWSIIPIISCSLWN